LVSSHHLINTGKNVAHESMNRTSHISNLQPTGPFARGGGMGFGMGIQVMVLPAPTQVGTDRATH
jgi:hypothetical protein